MPVTNISDFILPNISEPLSLKTQLDKALTWSKLLSILTTFTRTEIDLNVRKCGKLEGTSTSKTSVRGNIFIHELFLSSESV